MLSALQSTPSEVNHPSHENRSTQSSSSSQTQRDRKWPALSESLLAAHSNKTPGYNVDHTNSSKVDGYREDQGRDVPLVRGGGTSVADSQEAAASNQAERPTEAALLRDLPFILQGLSTTNFLFTSPTTLHLPSTLPLPLISLLHTLAEPSLLYRSLSDFIQSRDEGLIGQSLRSAIGSELRSYLGLIATLEGEIRRDIASENQNEPRTGIGKAGVTLKKCVVWTRDATMGLRLMSLMAEESQSKVLVLTRGGIY